MALSILTIRSTSVELALESSHNLGGEDVATLPDVDQLANLLLVRTIELAHANKRLSLCHCVVKLTGIVQIHFPRNDFTRADAEGPVTRARNDRGYLLLTF